jgi:hypothetical protein
MKQTVTVHAFTVKYPGLTNRITTDLTVFPVFNPTIPPEQYPKGYTTKALWDTGATHSVITQETANGLSLTPIAQINLTHAGGTGLANSYLVNFFLPNKVGFAGIQVSECKNIVGDFGAIIGMDIISQGDLAITNIGGKTCMTFRVPSAEKIDFVAEINKKKFSGVGRNSPCPCGSGKKFKRCCENKLHP